MGFTLKMVAFNEDIWTKHDQTLDFLGATYFDIPKVFEKTKQFFEGIYKI